MFSVIIPVHNKLPHLKRSINSVLNQSYKDFEIILIDDASTDGSTEKLKEFVDPRITQLRRDVPGPGGYAARNLGVRKAEHEWISFLDADDEWDTDYLLEVHKAIKSHEDIKIITTNWVSSSNNVLKRNPVINPSSKIHIRFSLIEYLKDNSKMWTSASTIKKALLIDSGLFPEGKCKRGGDMDTWIRCLYKSDNNIFINKELVTYFRDTVNQVTDTKLNPATKLCSYDTIESIRSESQDEKLLFALDVFSLRYVYSFMSNELRMSNRINKSKMFMVRSNRLKIQVLFKIYMKMLLSRIKSYNK